MNMCTQNRNVLLDLFIPKSSEQRAHETTGSSLSGKPKQTYTKKMGAARLELAKTEVEGFTVPCNCHYATPPKDCWRKELNPQPPDYKSGALPIELHQHKTNKGEFIKTSFL